MIQIKNTISFLIIILGSLVFPTLSIGQNSDSNIIFILADDLSWIGTQLEMINGREDSKSDWYETPNIIRLANEGTKFSNAYFRLFDIKLNDIEEAIDIADANPELVKSLKLELRDYLKEVNSYALKLNPEWSKNNGTKDGDADDDGLDDIWEFRNLLSTQFNGNDGPDNDGFSNEEEETKGGDPLVFNATL